MDDFNLEDTLAHMVKQGLMEERWNEDEQQFEYTTTELGIRTLVAHEKAAKEKRDDKV